MLSKYIRNDIAVTAVLVAGVILLGSFRPAQSMAQIELQIERTTEAMGGAEFTPQASPHKPHSEVTLRPASDGGWDVVIALSNFLPGGFDQPNPDHLAVGYPYLIVDGRPIGRFYGNTIHLPALRDGEHMISVYYEMPNGGLYRLFDEPIVQSLNVRIQGRNFELIHP